MPPFLTPYSRDDRTKLEQIAKHARLLTETLIVPVICGDKQLSFAPRSPLFRAPAMFRHQVYDLSCFLQHYLDHLQEYDGHTIRDEMIVGCALFWDGSVTGEQSRRKSTLEFAFVTEDYPQCEQAEQAIRERFQQYEQIMGMFPMARI
jgi:hypothetical protein